jgi:hypothetical protein
MLSDIKPGATMTTLALIALVLWLLPPVLVALVVLWFFFLPGTEQPIRRALRWLRRNLWRRL